MAPRLDGPVRAPDRARGAGAHRDAEDVRPAARRARGPAAGRARRRAKRLLFPTEDGELVLLVHLMSAGRLRYLRPGEKGPKTPAFRLRFEDGGELVLTEAGREEARRRLAADAGGAVEAELAHLGPEADTLDAAALAAICAASRGACTRCCATSGRSPGSAAPGRTRSCTPAKLSPFALSRDLADEEVEGLAAAIDEDLRRALELRERGGRTRRSTASTTASASPATSAATARPRRLRGAHDLLLPGVPDRRPRAQGPPALAPAAVAALGSLRSARQSRSYCHGRPRYDKQLERGEP